MEQQQALPIHAYVEQQLARTMSCAQGIPTPVSRLCAACQMDGGTVKSTHAYVEQTLAQATICAQQIPTPASRPS
jgi:hypothetical protein